MSCQLKQPAFQVFDACFVEVLVFAAEENDLIPKIFAGSMLSGSLLLHLDIRHLRRFYLYRRGYTRPASETLAGLGTL